MFNEIIFVLPDFPSHKATGGCKSSTLHFVRVAGLGLEPRFSPPEGDVLPLDDPAMFNLTYVNFHTWLVQEISFLLKPLYHTRFYRISLAFGTLLYTQMLHNVPT